MDKERRRGLLHSILASNPYPVLQHCKSIYQATLQDIVFVGQETGKIPEFYEFPIRPGIGTANYSRKIDSDLEDLERQGVLYGTAGLWSPLVLITIPIQTSEEERRLEQVKQVCNGSICLGFVAAYLMSRKKEITESESLSEIQLRHAAQKRLGWPCSVARTIEKVRQQLLAA